MAVCGWCRREMTKASSCAMTAVDRGFRPVRKIRWGEEELSTASGRCHDCGVQPGGFHHPSCDVEECPTCHGQLLCCSCEDEAYGFDVDVEDGERGRYLEDVFIDSGGAPTEQVRLASGQEILIHYADLPEKDCTVLHGIPITTALRTVIDVAPGRDLDEARQMVNNALGRHLFTIEEARARIAEEDMAKHPGAQILGRILDG